MNQRVIQHHPPPNLSAVDLTRTDSGVPPRWRCYHRKLVAFHDRLLRQREERSAALHMALERAGTDAADIALAQRENFEILAAISAEDVEIEEIRAALGRIHDGTYGICHATGRGISAERLRAIPWTRFCKEAAAERESRGPFSPANDAAYGESAHPASSTSCYS